MAPSQHAVLTAVVDRVEERGEPVALAALVESLDASEATLEDAVRSLCDSELLEATADGYRPTVTARELLALDVDLDDVLVLDPFEE